MAAEAPRPWHTEGSAVVDANGGLVAVAPSGRVGPEKAFEHARVIAASPDLREAGALVAKAMRSYMSRLGDCESWLDTSALPLLEAALRKAECGDQRSVGAK